MRYGSALPLAALVAACSAQTAEPEPSETSSLMASPSPEPVPVRSTDQTFEARRIPPAMQGRWALVPNDCTSTRGDAKGLLVAGPSSLRHYESVGTLNGVTKAGADHLSGTFAYTGEGMNWTREVTLSLADDGKRLVFGDTGDDGPPGNRTYTRCP